MFTLAVETIILDYLKESLITEDFVKKFQVLYVKFFRLAKHIYTSNLNFKVSAHTENLRAPWRLSPE